MDETSSNHILNNKWDLYYHLPNDNNWNISGYKIIMKDISTVEEVIALNNKINGMMRVLKIIFYCVLFFFLLDILNLFQTKIQLLKACIYFGTLLFPILLLSSSM